MLDVGVNRPNEILEKDMVQKAYLCVHKYKTVGRYYFCISLFCRYTVQKSTLIEQTCCSLYVCVYVHVSTSYVAVERRKYVSTTPCQTHTDIIHNFVVSIGKQLETSVPIQLVLRSNLDMDIFVFNLSEVDKIKFQHRTKINIYCS